MHIGCKAGKSLKFYLQRYSKNHTFVFIIGLHMWGLTWLLGGSGGWPRSGLVKDLLLFFLWALNSKTPISSTDRPFKWYYQVL